MKTVNADTGQVETPPAQNVQPASIIDIPHGVAVTICWIAVGFAIGWWMYSNHGKNHNRQQ